MRQGGLVKSPAISRGYIKLAAEGQQEYHRGDQAPVDREGAVMATNDKFGDIRPLVLRDMQNGIGISVLNLKRVVTIVAALNGMLGVGSEFN